MLALLFVQPRDTKALGMTNSARSASERVRKARCEFRKFAKKLDTYCTTFNTADVVASASGISGEDLRAIREGKRDASAPEKKRILDRFPNINRL